MSIDTKIARLHEHVFARPYKSIDELIGRLTTEGPIGMRAAGRITATHSATCHRWATEGLLLPDGTRLRLESIKSGGRVLTSKPALMAFIAAQQRHEPNGSAEAGPRSPHVRTVASERAAKELVEMGC